MSRICIKQVRDKWRMELLNIMPTDFDDIFFLLERNYFEGKYDKSLVK